MLKHIRVVVAAMLMTVLGTGLVQSAAPSAAHLRTFDAGNGERYFALSLEPGATLPLPKSHEVLILVDTSASQTGAYRTDGLEAVQTIVRGLSPQDQVQLAAVDLKFVPLTEGFVSPNSSDVQQAIDRLNARTPLGSTDMVTGLESAASRFDGDTQIARHIIYVGDGISHADLLSKDQFREVAKQLASERITVTSYAIGPQRDVHFLVALANQTGGQVFVDATDVSGQQAGQALVTALASPVVWTGAGGLERLGSECYPQTIPPLRADRDTILIGQLPNDATELAQPIVLHGSSAGQTIELTWSCQVHESSEDFAFLPRLVDMARADGGASLPTLNSEALREIRRLMLAGSASLEGVTGQVLVTIDGQHESVTDNGAPDREDNAISATETWLVQDEILQLGPEDSVLPDQVLLDDVDGDLLITEQPSGLLDEAMESRRLNTEFIKSELARGLDDARQIMRADPATALMELKTLRESISQAPDLDGDMRSQLLGRIDTALQMTYQQKVEKDHRDQLLRENTAQALERERLLDMARREDDLIRTYIEQFNSRLDERRYDLAIEAAELAFEVEPRLVATMAAQTKGRLATAYAEIMEIRSRRQQAVIDTLMSVERSAIPFPDDPPLVYPDAQTWENLTNSRKKYAQVDFATTNKAEQKILDELNSSTKIDFFDDPLADAISYLEQLHGIQIEVNQAALDEIGISTDATINKQLSGITLRSALKLMLRDLGLTYVIEDEVLQITTPEDAQTQTVTKVYPVADLVLPIQSIGGGMMGGGMMGGGMMGGGMGGGMMGGMGGGMGGGMMGGMGGMGGGMMGGMGGMGGGMGGFFDVEDRPSLNASKANRSAESATAPTTSTKAREIKLDDAALPATWDRYFGQAIDQIPENDVRETLRRRMGERDFDSVVTILQAALRQGYVRPWMYEALALALQANQAPADEVERAIMSAADLSGSTDEVMMAAVYLAKSGHSTRALKMFREVAQADPLRPEPYIQGLELATRLDDADGIQWAVTSILSRAWPDDQRDIQDKAIRIAQTTLKSLKEQDQTAYNEFRSALEAAIARDCEVTVSWTGDADVDVMVEEPAGTVCSLRSQRTTSGGMLLGDSFSHSDSNGSSEVSETYVCPEGFSGRYRMLVRRVWGDVTAGKVTVDVYINRHTSEEKHIRRQIPLADKDAMVVFDVDHGRRAEALQEHQVISAVTAQTAASRAVLAQHLNSVSESEAVTNLAIARARLAGGNQPFPFFRNPGAVGYQPNITQLPEGANLIAATAVISADRRYVRFSGLPFFSTIGEVQTFNFFTGNTGNGGGLGGGGATGGLGGGIGGGF